MSERIFKKDILQQNQRKRSNDIAKIQMISDSKKKFVQFESYLSPKDLVLSASISRTWRHLAEDHILWMKKCFQYNIKEIFPPNLARRENWALFSAGLVDSPQESPHYFDGDSPFSSKISSSFCKSLFQSPSSSLHFSQLNLPSCLERSKWKAIYLRNQHISNNWRFRRPNAICHLRGHDEHVITCLKLRGDRLVTGSDDCTLRVWFVGTGECTQVLTGHTGGVWALQLSEDGKIAISGSTDRTVRVWNVETGVLMRCLNGHSSSRDCTIRMWNIEEGRCIRPFIGHLAAVRCVKYAGSSVVSGGYDHKIHVWNAENGTLEHVLEGHTHRVYSLHFVKERNLVISGSLDTTIRVWNVKTGECLQTLVGHQSLTSGMKLRGNKLISANADSTIKVWNILDGTCIHTLAGPNKHASAVTGFRFLDNGMIATSGDDGTVKLWDIEEGSFICDLIKLPSSGAGGCVWRMKATPTMLVCAVGSRNGTEDTKLVLMDFDGPYP
uniref:F-box domain-containing protein n=2 Tax=Meloidogyne TaxID=189290 RepID=A0A915PFY6_9BILA